MAITLLVLTRTVRHFLLLPGVSSWGDDLFYPPWLTGITWIPPARRGTRDPSKRAAALVVAVADVSWLALFAEWQLPRHARGGHRDHPPQCRGSEMATQREVDLDCELGQRAGQPRLAQGAVGYLR